MMASPWVVIPLWVFASSVLLLRTALRRQLAPSDHEAALAAGKALLASQPARAVAIGAHPDDLEYYCGATLAQLAASGGRVAAVLATSGERGGRAPNLAAIRQEEQRRAAEILGYARVIFLGLPDRGVQHDAAFEARLAAILQEECPSALFTFDAAYPLRPYVHPDHQAVGWAAASAAARVCPHVPMYLFHTRRPNTAVPVGAAARLKQAALAAHQSQRRGGRRLLIHLAGVLLERFWALGEGAADEEWFRLHRVGGP